MTGQGETTAAELLASARKCRQDEQRARRALNARERALHVSVARALAGGVDATVLAEHFGVSRQRIYQMKDAALKPQVN